MKNSNGNGKQQNHLTLTFSDDSRDGQALVEILGKSDYAVEQVFSASSTPEAVYRGRYVKGYDQIILAFVPGGQREARRILSADLSTFR